MDHTTRPTIDTRARIRASFAPALLSLVALLLAPVVASAADRHDEPVLNEVDFHFVAAREALLDARPDDAADELRTSAAFVALEARRCDTLDGELEKELRRTARGLGRLASRIERGKVDDPAELDRAFLQADHVLVRHHARHARIAWDQGDHAAAGRHLCAVAGHLEHGLRWAGDDSLSRAAFGDLHRLALDLVHTGESATDTFPSDLLDRHLAATAATLASLEPYVDGRIERTEGIVTAYDREAGTLSIRTRRGRTRTFETDGALAEVAEVAEGERVSLTYATDGRRRTVRTLQTSPVTSP